MSKMYLSPNGQKGKKCQNVQIVTGTKRTKNLRGDILKIVELINNSQISNENIKFNEPMKNHTSFKIGGPAECFIKITTIEQLKELLKFVKDNNINLSIIGNGSNILVSDSGIDGIVAEIAIKKYEILENNKIVLGAGNKISEIAQKLLKDEFTGFEELSGIPGTIGGAIRMNAGANGKEMKDLVETVTLMDRDGNIRTLKNDEMQFEYRKSILKIKDDIVIQTTICLQKGKKEEIKNKMDELKEKRTKTQPLEYPSAGSTFKRGEDFITAKLIDEAGLKGYKIGDAQISEKHAGFIINKGNATAKDVLQLIKYTQDKIFKNTGKKIEPEIEMIGKNL